MICKVSFPTFLDTLGVEEEKWLFTACALVGTLALETVAVAALTGARVLVVLWGALLCAHTVLEKVAIHAL